MNDLYSLSFNQEEHAKQSHFNGDFEKTPISFKTKSSQLNKNIFWVPFGCPFDFPSQWGFPFLSCSHMID